jgi:hypothetical protein
LLVDRRFDDVGGLGKDLLDTILLAAAQLTDEVARVIGMDEPATLLRLGVVGDCRQGLVVDDDKLGGVLCHVPVRGHHQSHRVSDEARLALGQRRQR